MHGYHVAQQEEAQPALEEHTQRSSSNSNKVVRKVSVGMKQSACHVGECFATPLKNQSGTLHKCMSGISSKIHFPLLYIPSTLMALSSPTLHSIKGKLTVVAFWLARPLVSNTFLKRPSKKPEAQGSATPPKYKDHGPAVDHE